MTKSSVFINRITGTGYLLFGIFWLLALLIYLPAFSAGRVWDFPGLVVEYRRLSFMQYLDRSWSGIAGLYHFTQLVTWLGFKAFGVHAWPWHLLFITIHALDGWLLYKLFCGVLEDARFTRAKAAALLGGALFVISPYAAEVVVWLPSYHYLQAIALMCGILICVRSTLHRNSRRYYLLAGLLFLCSIFSLELFYFTPVLTMAMLLWYRYGLRWSAAPVRKVWLLIVLPQLLLMGLYVCLLTYRYGVPVPRGGGAGIGHYHQYFSTPVKNAFHLALHGRYWPQAVRDVVYQFAERKRVLIIVAIAVLVFVVVARKRSVFTLPLAWCAVALISTYPLSFSPLFVTQYDRYVYFPSAFAYPLIAMALVAIAHRGLKRILILTFSLSAAACAFYVSLLWGKGDRIVQELLNNHPPASGKKIIILNSPEIYRGVPMIGASENHNYNVLSGAIMPPQQRFSDSVWEACSYNLEHGDDGAHAEVINDSMVRVTLNQWGTWWWYSYRGAGSYESDYYRVDMKDAGHTYDLILKRRAENFDLWYCADKRWKVVDMNIRDKEQY